MKNRIMTIIIATGVLSQLCAQQAGDINFGIMAGPNFTFPGGGDIYDLKQEAAEDSTFNAPKPVTMRVGAHIGLRMEYFPSAHAGFGTGLIYNQKGWTEEYRVQNTEEEEYKIRLHYIEVPLLLVVNLKGFHIYGGPAVSILVLDRAKYEHREFNDRTGDFVPDEEIKGSVAAITEYETPPKSFTGGFCFGLKGQLPKGITVGAGLSFTAPVFPSASEDPVNINMSTLQISLGKVFTWKSGNKEETQNAYSEELKNLKANYDQLSTQVASVSDDLAVVNQKVSPVSSMHLKIDELATDVEGISDEIKNLKTGSPQTGYSDYPDKEETPEPKDPDPRLTVPCYVISCGVFGAESAARQKTRELQQKGLAADYYYIPEYDRYGKPQYRVYVGPYKTKPQAEDMLPKVGGKVPGAWVLWVEQN